MAGGLLRLPSKEQLEDMTHDDLQMLRNRLNNDPEAQKVLAPYEHQAFTRERVKQLPISSIGLLAAIPLYQIAKMTGLHSARTPPSMDQVVGGLKGIWQGFR